MWCVDIRYSNGEFYPNFTIDSEGPPSVTKGPSGYWFCADGKNIHPAYPVGSRPNCGEGLYWYPAFDKIPSIENLRQGNCSNQGQDYYDCVNGNCVKSNVYGTPGKYLGLTNCQNDCGNNNTNSCNPPFQCIDPENFCPPGKVCVPQDEWGQIVGLVQQNVAKHCK